MNHQHAETLRYRLLTRGEVIERSDECLTDDTLSWVPLDSTLIGPGMQYDGNFFVPMRRIVAAHAQAGEGSNNA